VYLGGTKIGGTKRRWYEKPGIPLVKKKSCAILGEWKQSISNHMYWCAASSNGDGQQEVAKWLEGHSEAFPRCACGPLQEGRKWLRGSKSNKLLVI